MVSVPRYGGLKASPAGPQNVQVSTRAPIEAFGGGPAAQNVFQAAGDLAAQAQKLAAAERRKGQQMRLVELESQLADAESQHKLNLQKIRGRDALPAADEAVSGFDEVYKKLDLTVNDPELKDALRRSYLGRKTDLNFYAQSYASRQITEYDNTATEEFIKKERDSAAIDYGNPERVGISVARQKAALSDFAERNGMPPEWVVNRTSDVESKTYRMITEKMLQDGASIADVAKFVTDRKGSISVSDYEAVEQNIRQTEAVRARELFHETMELAEKVLPREPALKVEDLISSEQWDSLDTSQRKSLQARAKQLRERGEPETDWALYYDLKTSAVNDATRSEFVKLDLMKSRPHLADAQFKELVDIQTAAMKGGNEAVAKLAEGYRTTEKIVDDALEIAKIGPEFVAGRDNEAGKKRERSRAALFRKLVDDGIRDLQLIRGHKLDPEEIQKDVVDDLLIKRRTSSGDKYLFDMAVEERKALDPMKVGQQFMRSGEEVVYDVRGPVTTSIQDREKIINALRRGRIPVTEENIQRLYIKKWGGADAHR